VCRYYAESGPSFLTDEEISSGAQKSFVSYEPLGIILAVMPWNFPFWQVFRFAAPALLLGNAGVLKHASNVSKCALAIEEVIRDAGFEEGIFQTLLISVSKVERVLRHPDVKGATLTGSEKAGASVSAIAGEEIKKTVLELGGSDPFVVLEDADLDLAVDKAVAARMLNTGQSCIAAKRFIVHQSIYDQFKEQLVTKLSALKQGDPFSDDTDYGPLCKEEAAQNLFEQIQESEKFGANATWIGATYEGEGAYFSPVILENIQEDNPAYYEELFGPVYNLFSFETDEEAEKIANATSFGLGASVWTKDEQKGLEWAKRIQAGAVFINEMVKSDPRLPFGGIKKSGYGRELSELGIKEFANAKTVYLA
jgi:succinate-semialdehyde dehydrogenase/glutarate-semialdehyde dehydrogenase